MESRVLSTRKLVSWLLNYGLLLGLWFLYTDSFNTSELLVALGAAALATTGTAIVQGEMFAEFAPRPQWLLLIFREPWPILKDSITVWLHALRAIAGRQPAPEMRAVSFNSGGDDHRSAARRALAITLTTIPPNTIVVGIDRHQNLALVHFLRPEETPSVLKELGTTQ